MKRFLGNIFLILFFFTLGFWVSEHNVLEGTKAGDLFSDIVTQIPVPTPLHSWKEGAVKETDFTTKAFKQKLNGKTSDSTASVFLDSSNEYEEIEARIFERLNTLRKEKNVPELTKNDLLKQAGDIRASETEISFSHTRPNGEEPFTVLNETTPPYNYRLAGENLGMATFVLSDEKMADLIFDGWVESQGHYENMINPDFREIGIGVHANAENLYLTQIFGTSF